MDQNLPLQIFATWTLFGLAVRLVAGRGYFSQGTGSQPVSIMLDAATWPHVVWMAWSRRRADTRG